jgi:hypothetical protein
MLVSCWGFSSQNLRFSLSIYVCLRTPDCLWFYFFDGYYEICSVLHSSGQYGNSLPLYVFTSPEFSPYHYSHQRGKWKGNALVSSWGASWPFPPVSLTKKVKYYYLLRRKNISGGDEWNNVHKFIHLASSWGGPWACTELSVFQSHLCISVEMDICPTLYNIICMPSYVCTLQFQSKNWFWMRNML